MFNCSDTQPSIYTGHSSMTSGRQQQEVFCASQFQHPCSNLVSGHLDRNNPCSAHTALFLVFFCSAATCFSTGALKSVGGEASCSWGITLYSTTLHLELPGVHAHPALWQNIQVVKSHSCACLLLLLLLFSWSLFLLCLFFSIEPDRSI